MALPAQRHDPKSETGRDDDGICLDGNSVLAALERELGEDGIEDIPRGIVLGALFGLALWVGIVGTYFLLALL